LGEIFFWRTGSANYLWAICVLLTFGLPIRYLVSTDSQDVIGNSKPKTIFLTVMGFFAGITNENTVGAFLILYIGVFFHHFIKKKRLSCWVYSSFSSLLAGFIFMLRAPSTVKRIQFYNELFGINSLRITDYISRIPTVTSRFFFDNIFLVLFALICILVGLLYWSKCSKEGEKKSILPQLEPFGWLMLMGVMSCGALILSPYVETRAFLLTDFMMVICIVYYSHLFFSSFRTQTLSYAMVALLLAVTIPCMGQIYYTYQDYNGFCIQREGAIYLSENQPFIWGEYAGPYNSRILTTREDYCKDKSAELSNYFQKNVEVVSGYIQGDLDIDDYTQELYCLGGIDYIEYNQGNGRISTGGWIGFQNIDNEENETYIVVETELHKYYYKTTTVERPDVVDVLGDTGLLYSGFQMDSQSINNNINQANAKVGVCVVNREKKIWGEIIHGAIDLK